MRTSGYIISVKIPNSKKYILVHGYSGAIDLVHENVINFLRKNEGRNKNKLVNVELISKKTIDILEKRGYLTNKSLKEEKNYIKRLGKILYKLQTPKTPGLLIIPTYECNLRCSYCISKHLFSKNISSLKIMSKSLVNEIYKYIENLIPEKSNNEKIRITLYGGEPLLAKNREIIEYIVKEGINRNYRFRAITNGVELDYFTDLLGENKIESVQITLDGPPQIHDKRRIGPNYPATFKIIEKNIDLALEAGARVDIRVNIDKGNIGSLPELEKFIQEKGWYSKKDFYVEGHPVHRGGKELLANDLTLQDVHRFCERCQENGIPFINIADYDISKVFKKGLEKGVFIPYKAHNCSANTKTGMYIFDPLGDIYNCWASIGIKSFRIGYYIKNKGFFINKKEQKKWTNRTVFNIPECLKCKFLFFCKGGCAFFALNKTGKINSPSCYDFDNIFSSIIIETLKREGILNQCDIS